MTLYAPDYLTYGELEEHIAEHQLSLADAERLTRHPFLFDQSYLVKNRWKRLETAHRKIVHEFIFRKSGGWHEGADHNNVES